jgi:nickel-type superoxide dismutase maturation protease
MAPALRPGDFLVVDRAAYRARPPRPGEVVVAGDPRAAGRTLIKRVAGYDAGLGAWLLGDNPGESTDSRVFGYVAATHLRGRVRWRYWPIGRRPAASMP